MKMKGLLKAAKKGNTFAQCQIGTLYFRGIGVEQNFHEALLWYERAGTKGDVTSQFRLGLMYSNGSGVKQDNAEAVRWLKKAALQGHTGAKLYLGILCGNGTEIDQDFDKVMRLFCQETEQEYNIAPDDFLSPLQGLRDLLQ